MTVLFNLMLIFKKDGQNGTSKEFHPTRQQYNIILVLFQITFNLHELKQWNLFILLAKLPSLLGSHADLAAEASFRGLSVPKLLTSPAERVSQIGELEWLFGNSDFSFATTVSQPLLFT